MALVVGRLLSLAALVCCTQVAVGATKDVKSVVAKVGAEWTDETKLQKLHEELAGKFKDAPSLEELRSKDRWVVVVDITDAKRSYSVAARTAKVGSVKKGDVVEVSYSEAKAAKSYADLPEVTRVVCKAGAPGYDECVTTTNLGAFDGSGKKVSWGE
jgi:hypothetical protein